MPSIFNHENNACWGIRRTSYNIFNEPTSYELNIQKSNENVYGEEMKVANYHGSSNGYYGYHIPTRAESTDNCDAMDTSYNYDFDSEHVNNAHIVSGGCGHNDLGSRKRGHSNETQDSCKRSKKDEHPVATFATTNGDLNRPESGMLPAVDDSASTDGLPVYNFYRYVEMCKEDVRSVHMKRRSIEEESLEFFENYLKQTHGCDFYNFINSDYDL